MRLIVIKVVTSLEGMVENSDEKTKKLFSKHFIYLIKYFVKLNYYIKFSFFLKEKTFS